MSLDYTKTRMDELVRLTEEQIPEMAGAVKQFHPLEVPLMPSIHYRLTTYEPSIATSVRNEFIWDLDCLIFCTAANEDDVETSSHEWADRVTKVFGVNAKSDVSTTHSGNYHTNGAFWYRSEMGHIEFYGSETNPLVRMIRFPLKLYAQLIP